MLTAAAVWAALDEVKDPEIPPVSVVDMGMVADVSVDEGQVQVTMMPTFVGCPALEIIRRDVAARLRQVEGVAGVAVAFVFDPPWSSERITAQGRERLKTFGIAPPAGGCMGSGLGPGSGATMGPGGLLSLEDVPTCPYCGSGDTHLENLFGPTACRSIYYCDGCRQPFEAIKAV